MHMLANQQLPPEVWSGVISHLPFREQRVCLFLSRFYYDLAVRYVFAIIKIYFLGEDPVSLDFAPQGEEISEEKSRSLVSQSWDILDHITKHSKFSKAVKKIIVHAFDTGKITFEQRWSHYVNFLHTY
jgi:hypothetical protein